MFANQILKRGLLLANVPKVLRSKYHAGHDKPVTMDDLPVPKGDWYAHHARQNAKYNACLIAGILCLSGTVGVLLSTNIVDFNALPPKLD